MKKRKIFKPIIRPDIFTVTIFDTETGLIATVAEWDKDYWINSNGFCDCNRCTAFGVPDKYEGVCDGCHRFVIVETSDTKYWEKDNSLDEMNDGYPEATVLGAIKAYQQVYKGFKWTKC